MPEHVLDIDDIERGIRAGYNLSGEAALAMVNEIRRLHVALGQQTDQVKRKQNRISTLDHRLRKARVARDADSLEAARLTEALEAIDEGTDCSGFMVDACFDDEPEHPELWCPSCVAHIALIPPPASS